jgi:hypothetical protein
MSDSRLVWASVNHSRGEPSHDVTQIELCDARLLILDRRSRYFRGSEWQEVLFCGFIAFMLFGDLRLIAKGVDFFSIRRLWLELRPQLT